MLWILHVQHVVEAVANMHARHDNGLASLATFGSLLQHLAINLPVDLIFHFSKSSWSFGLRLLKNMELLHF